MPTKSTNQNDDSAATKPKVARVAVALPTNLAAVVSDVAIAGRSTQTNPLTEVVKTANANRNNTYDVGPAPIQPVHDKIVRLLQSAAREAGCSVRTSTFGQYKDTVKFRCVNKITRTQKPKADATTVAAS